jgi:hypothetical protein
VQPVTVRRADQTAHNPVAGYFDNVSAPKITSLGADTHVLLLENGATLEIQVLLF